MISCDLNVMRTSFRKGSNSIKFVLSKVRIVGRFPRQCCTYFAIHPATPDVTRVETLSRQYIRYFAAALNPWIIVRTASTMGAAGPNVPNGSPVAFGRLPGPDA